MINGFVVEVFYEDEEDVYDEEFVQDEYEEEVIDEYVEEEDEYEEVDDYVLEFFEFVFEVMSVDNNFDKVFGGCIVYVFFLGIEVGVFYYMVKYDDDEELGFIVIGFDINWIGNYYIVRGEYIKIEIDVFEEDEYEENKVIIFDCNGWYF